MGLLQSLLTEGRKDIIINKIGLPEDVANWITNKVHKKFQIWFANYIIDSVKEINDGMRTDQYDKLIDSLVNDNGEIDVSWRQTFDRGLHVINNVFRVDMKPKLDIREYTKVSSVMRLTNQYTTIRDWARGITPTPNLKQMEWEDAYNQAREWHDNLKASNLSANITDVAPDAEIIHTFDDGYKWVDMHTSNCSKLGSLMGHCANTDADTMLQLITDKGKFKVTVAFDYDGTYHQAKGTQNNKPDEKYTPYMTWLFTNGGDYQLKEYAGEYESSRDFGVDDLPDDVREDVLEKYPALDKDSIEKAERLYDDGKLDEAIDVLDNAIQENVGYNAVRPLAFGGNFWEVYTNYDFSDADWVLDDLIDGTKSYYYETWDHINKLALGLLTPDQFIEKILEDIDEESYYNMIDLIMQLTTDEQNNIIMHIVKQDPSKYKGLTSHNNREMIIKDVIEKKMEIDSKFRGIYDYIINRSSSYTYDNVKRVTDKTKFWEVIEFLKELPDMLGFSEYKDEDGNVMLSYIVQMDIYEADYSTLYSFHDDRVQEDIRHRADELDKYYGGTRKGKLYTTHNNLSEFAKILKTHTDEVTVEKVIIMYILKAEVPSDALKDLRQKLINIDLLDSTLVPASDTSQQGRLELTV